MVEKLQPVDEADVTEEIVETVKEVMGEYHQGKARQLATMLLGVFKPKGWEVIGSAEPAGDEPGLMAQLTEAERAKIREMRSDEARRKRED